LRAAILALLAAPFLLLLLAAGVVFMWENPWLFRWIWIPIPICWLASFVLYRIARRHYGSLWRPRADPLMHWTERDRQAWQQVLAYADQTEAAAAGRFASANLYWETTSQLAKLLATHYHPNAKDAIENLTIPEILTAAELAVSDLRRFVEQNIPGSHLMTVRWLQRAPQMSNLWRSLRPFYYAASLVWHPWTVLSRAAANETVINPVMDELKKEGMSGLYRAFVLQLGKYLIELNSHRLRVGPDRWRELMDPSPPAPAKSRVDQRAPGETSQDQPSSADTDTLRIALVGQVKAGKSSLINSLTGIQQAAVDVLPLTDTIEQYTLSVANAPDHLVLLDTAGYGHEGWRADRVDETMQAICGSAMTVLVMKADNPAREPDLSMLSHMQSWFGDHPQLRRPPVLVVLTHVDHLSPSLEWDPPYPGWVEPKPKRAKEQSMRELVVHMRQLLGSRVDGIVPVCTDVERDHVYGVTEWVVPALLNLLPQARGKQLLDVLFDQRDRGRVSQLTRQLWNAATTLAKYQFCGLAALLPTADAQRSDGEP
jgi:predicted GTPase